MSKSFSNEDIYLRALTNLASDHRDLLSATGDEEETVDRILSLLKLQSSYILEAREELKGEPAEKPAEKPTEKPAEKAAKPTEKPTEKATEKTVAKSKGSMFSVVVTDLGDGSIPLNFKTDCLFVTYNDCDCKDDQFLQVSSSFLSDTLDSVARCVLCGVSDSLVELRNDLAEGD